jgi:hypothetical protein
LLYQSKPSIEALEATTAAGGRKRFERGGTAEPKAVLGASVQFRRLPSSTLFVPYLSHQTNPRSTPRPNVRKRRNHSDFRMVGRPRLGRPAAELTHSAPGPRLFSRTPANQHLLAIAHHQVSAESDRPNAAFREQMRLRQIVDPERR